MTKGERCILVDGGECGWLDWVVILAGKVGTGWDNWVETVLIECYDFDISLNSLNIAGKFYALYISSQSPIYHIFSNTGLSTSLGLFCLSVVIFHACNKVAFRSL